MVPPVRDEGVPTDSASQLFHHIYNNFSLAAASLLPNCIIMSSCSDSTIPWYSSTYFAQLLGKAGVNCRNLMYNHAKHIDFVSDYTLKPPKAASNPNQHPSYPAASSNAASQTAYDAAMSWLAD